MDEEEEAADEEEEDEAGKGALKEKTEADGLDGETCMKHRRKHKKKENRQEKVTFDQIRSTLSTRVNQIII